MPSRWLIRIYGDSLSMPRVSERVDYYQTYGEMLAAQWRASLPDTNVYLYNRSFSGVSAPALYETFRSDSFYFGRPGGIVAIIQCGIVDCAPRPLPGWLRACVSRLPGRLRSPIIAFLHSHRAQILNLSLSWRVTPPKQFLDSMTRILSAASGGFDRIYVMNIAPTTPKMELHSPGLSDSIRMYNGLIERAIASVGDEQIVLLDVHRSILDTPGGVETCISELDGHHLTPAGHQLYLRLIVEHERKYGLRPSTTTEPAAC